MRNLNFMNHQKYVNYISNLYWSSSIAISGTSLCPFDSFDNNQRSISFFLTHNNLASSIMNKFLSNDSNVFILENHGLIKPQLLELGNTLLDVGFYLDEKVYVILHLEK